MVATALPYNRALHGDDYRQLDPYVATLREFERKLQGVNYRKDHQHREWEYAQALQQLADLFPRRVPASISVLDTGSGASYFPLLLKVQGYDVTVNDSMAYGDTTEWLRAQCFHLDKVTGREIRIPLVVAPLERLGLPDNTFDVTMCISVIEHLPTTEFANGLRELWRVTTPGGYLFLTSDYFKNWDHAKTSPSLGIQHNLFYPHTAERMINNVIDVEWVGGVDLTYHEPGLINGHSFVTFCLRKPR